jgi:predicted phage terminase large subunit-like protein
LPLKPNKKDKVTRAKEIAYYIESGMVFLPQDKDYSFNRELLTEIELFSGDGSAKHDDITDCIIYAVNVGLAGIGTSIFDT